MIEIRRRICTPLSGVSGMPATVAEPEVGAMSVPSVRTVVVFPAPFGPRKPNTSPWPISKETSSNATRSPKRLPRPSTDSAAALSVLGLGKRFGDRVAFDDVSFEIGHGEVFGFLGPNGAGKTTTVRTLGTLIAPTSGSATVAGIPLTPDNGVQIRRRISIMPESPGLYLRLSVAENLGCFADLYEAPNPGDRVDRALRAVNLADRASDACGSLCQGP